MTTNVTCKINSFCCTFISDGKIPKDTFIHESKMVKASTVMYVIVTVLNVSAIILTVGFLFFNVYYRNER